MKAGEVGYAMKSLKYLVSLLLLIISTSTVSGPLLGEQAKSLEKTDTIILEQKAQKIISSQIDAFRKLDVKTAYKFASPFIKSKFANPDVFGEMVASGYPMIWSPKEYKFLEFNLFNGALIQRVLFVDSMEKIFMFDYEIKEYGSNTWLINGVFPVNSSTSDV